MRRKRPTEEEWQKQELSEGREILSGMKEWRQEHPKATLREIEEAVDARLAKLRAGMVAELAGMSEQADWKELPPEERPTCEQCGAPLVSRGMHTRWLNSHGGQAVKLERRYGTCPQCGQGLFPPG